MIIPTTKESNNMSDTTAPAKEMTAGQAFAVLLSKLFGSGAFMNVVLILLFVGYVSYDQFVRKAPVTPPANPAVPVVPSQKSLKDLVGPDASVELADFYFALATTVYKDTGRPEKKNEGPVLKTIGDFYEMQQDAFQVFQTSTNTTGVAAINDPISMKLKTATGSLDPSRSLDDPATKVRDSIVAVCKQIAIEFDDRYAQIPLGQYR